MEPERDVQAEPRRIYWGRARSKVKSAASEQKSKESVKIGTTEALAPKLSLMEVVALSLFDRYRMPVWSIDKEGEFLASLNVAARRMCTLFAETMCAERPPKFTEDERKALVSKALAMTSVQKSYPTLFMTEEANWLMFPVDSEEACCVIVLVR